MKLSCALLATVAVADKKVPPRHPLQRLERLTEFSEELLTDWYFNYISNYRFFDICLDCFHVCILRKYFHDILICINYGLYWLQ